ncbi:MAG: LytR C-terminal domain-containing protein [Nocardioidaceae bacterium]
MDPSSFRRVGTPSWMVLAGVAVVLVAVVGFFMTGQRDKTVTVALDKPAPTAPATTTPTTPAKIVHKAVHHLRPNASVDVFNNAGITGLAASTSARLTNGGWTVTGSDNWYGNIPTTTVYYPSGMAAQAHLLATQLGVHRVRPEVAPMKTDRLTLILTGPLR